MLLNLFQVRLRAMDAPEGHLAEGTVRSEPQEVHPGEEVQVIVDLRFPEGGPPGSINVKASPPEDFEVGDVGVDLREDGATVTILATTHEEVELGTYYIQVVYSDEQQEHFEAEAPLEVNRHWVRIGDVKATPARASPGDPVDITADLRFEGTARVRGHVRGRLVPDEWGGEDEELIKLPRERSSVSDAREQTWHVRLPRSALETMYSVDVEFSSQEGTARRRVRDILLLVPQRAIHADRPEVVPHLLAPGDAVSATTRVENVGLEELVVRVAGELAPEAGGAPVPLEEREVTLGPGESTMVSWECTAPDRHGRWLVRVRARAERAPGADPEITVLDVRPPNQVHVVGAMPSRPWTAHGEAIGIALQLMDTGSQPGHDALVHVCLEGDDGTKSSTPWSGWVSTELVEARVTVEVPSAPDAGEGPVPGSKGSSSRYALVVRGRDEAELLRVPGALAIRRRVALEPRVVKAAQDPLRIGDARLPGERVLRTVTAGDITIIELSSGCRMYARGDLVAGVDEDLPMDDAFWDEALDADLRLYTDMWEGLQSGALAAEAEASLMKALGVALRKEGAPSSRLVKASRELASSFDPDRPSRRKGPKEGPLAPLVVQLEESAVPPGQSRDIVPELRRYLSSPGMDLPTDGPLDHASAAARAASEHLDRLAELLTRAWERDRIDMAILKAVTALVSATAVTQVEYYRLREVADPWAIPEEVSTAQKKALQASSRQLASLLELLSRHRTRRVACIVNTRQRAAQAAVTRDLEVRIPPLVGHSGDAARMEVELENRSPIDLEVRFNVALPGGAWTVLEPQARSSKGLMFVGPVQVPARSTSNIPLVVYVPTTARLDDYTIPVEVVPEGRDIVPEQWGETK